jgi:endonuclease V-like protein UPF0215 family
MNDKEIREQEGVEVNKPLDKEVKIILLQVLKRGFFTEDDITYLRTNRYIPVITIIKTYGGCPDDMQEEETL